MVIQTELMGRDVIHYPNLKTVLMVEQTLKNAELAISREELKKRLPTKIMHQTLNLIIEYLEKRGIVTDTHKGIVWTYNESPKLRKAIDEGTQL